MRVGSPLWKCVREAARCFLKAENVEIIANEDNIDLLDKLCKKIAEFQPQKIDFPTYQNINSTEITMNCDDVKIMICKNEPDVNINWLPSDKVNAITTFIQMVEELAEAGYPGCVGCIGSVDEKPWDEGISRLDIFSE